MRIVRLRINGFRGIANGDIRLSGHTVLIGPNGCGKSSIVDALSLVLGRSRLVRPLTEHDFTASDPGPASRIHIVATLAGFTSNDPETHNEWFQWSGAVPKWLDAKGQEQTEPTENSQLCINIGFCARFDRDELDIVSMRYFHDDDDTIDPFDDDGGLTQLPWRLITEVGLFVLPAKRDWDAVASFNSDLFRRTVINAAGIPADEIILQRNALRNPETKIENSAQLRALVDGLNGRLSRLVPNAPKFQLRVTTGDCEAVLQSLLPHYQTFGGPSLPASRHGSGLVSLQSLLLLLEVGRVRVENNLPFILALEEPELHLAPGLQGRLVAEAVQMANQVICTTHSPEVARVFPSTSVLILTNHDRQLSATPFLSSPLERSASNNERKLFIQNRSRVVSALMLPFVLVPEGRFDAEWLGRFAEIADSEMTKTTPFSTTFGIVPTENAAIVFTVAKLAPLRSRILTLIDGDRAGDEYVKTLLTATPAPRVVFQLPEGWTIEDVVVWSLRGQESSTLAYLREEFGAFSFSSLDELNGILKLTNDQRTKTAGLKEDVLAHEIIIALIDSMPECRARIVAFCEALVTAATDAPHVQAIKQPSSNPDVSVYRFQP